MTGINKFGGARIGDSMPVLRVDEQDLLRQQNFDASFRTISPHGVAMDIESPSGEGEAASNPFEHEAAINSARVLRAMLRGGVHPSHMTPSMLREASDSLAAQCAPAFIGPVVTQSVSETGAMHAFDARPPSPVPGHVPSAAIMANPVFYARYLGGRFR